MMRRTLPYVLVLAAGLGGGLMVAETIREPRCDSEDGCFDRAAYEQCEAMKGTKDNTAMKQRTVAKPRAPSVPGVSDWVFMAYCDGAPVPTVRVELPQTI